MSAQIYLHINMKFIVTISTELIFLPGCRAIIILQKHMLLFPCFLKHFYLYWAYPRWSFIWEDFSFPLES